MPRRSWISTASSPSTPSSNLPGAYGDSAYAGTGDRDKAIADDNQAIALDPDDDDAYFNPRPGARTLRTSHQDAIADFDASSSRAVPKDNDALLPTAAARASKRATLDAGAIADFTAQRSAITVRIPSSSTTIAASRSKRAGNLRCGAVADYAKAVDARSQRSDRALQQPRTAFPVTGCGRSMTDAVCDRRSRRLIDGRSEERSRRFSSLMRGYRRMCCSANCEKAIVDFTSFVYHAEARRPDLAIVDRGYCHRRDLLRSRYDAAIC